jgi:hypothetical protein
VAPALQAFHAARQHVGEALSAFEFFDEAALDVALRHVPGLEHPTPDQPVIQQAPLGACTLLTNVASLRCCEFCHHQPCHAALLKTCATCVAGALLCHSGGFQQR